MTLLPIAKVATLNDAFRCPHMPRMPIISGRTCVARQKLAAAAVTMFDRVGTRECRSCPDGARVAGSLATQTPDTSKRRRLDLSAGKPRLARHIDDVRGLALDTERTADDSESFAAWLARSPKREGRT